VLYISPDPYMRMGLMPAGGGEAGMPIKGFVCGRVLDSKSKQWFPGEFLGVRAKFTTALVLSEEALAGAWRLTGLINEETASMGVGILGMPGSTAYGGVLGVLRPKRAKKRGEPSGETFFVNAASGAVGQLAGQIAKAQGALVIGSAGGPEKCKTLLEKFGFDHAIDYKSVNTEEAMLAKLKELAPNGLDMVFENVGGFQFDAALKSMATNGRLAICGCISSYNAATADTNPFAGDTNPLPLGRLIYPQIRIEGFVSSEYLHGKKMNFLRDMQRMKRQFKFEISETITDGIENFGTAFNSLFTGANNGKVAVKICDPKPIWKAKENPLRTKQESMCEVQKMTDEDRKACLKAVRKEGGKKGVDVEGASHLGNTQFFCTTVTEPNGDLELLLASVKAMNATEPKVVRAHMERMGCSGELAKIVVSAHKDFIAVVAYVPEALQESLTPKDWLEEVMDWYGGEVVTSSEETCGGIIEQVGGNGMGYEVLIRHHCTGVLQRLKLMAQSDHVHDGEDEVFGDDELRGMGEDRKKSIMEKRKSIMSMKSHMYG